MSQLPLYPTSHINLLTPGALHKENLTVWPINYPKKTSKRPGSKTNGGTTYPPTGKLHKIIITCQEKLFYRRPKM